MRRKITDLIREWDVSGRRSTLMVRGARQVGKTYIIDDYCKTSYDNYLYINFADRPEVAGLFDNGSLQVDSLISEISLYYPDFRFVPGKTIIFFDEIQECPNARTALKPLAIDGRYRIVASGSLLGLNLEKVRLLPVGYVETLNMGPMDFEEYLWAMGVDENVIGIVKKSISAGEPINEPMFEALSKYHRWYMVVGGMPEAVSAFMQERQMSAVRRVHSKILGDYIDDIGKHASRSLRPKILGCFNAIPDILAQESKRFRYSEAKTAMDSDREKKAASENRSHRKTPTVGYRYFESALYWLDMADITLVCRHLTEPHLPFEEREIQMFKLYMLDTGLLMHMYDPRLAAEVISGNVWVNEGAMTENAIAMALSLQGRQLHYFSKNGEDRMEIDFISMVSGHPCAMEVKSGTKRTCRSLNKVMSRYGIGGIMFETRNVFTDEKGVRHFPLFAASFMDAIDPPVDIGFDLTSVDELNRIAKKSTEEKG